MNMYYLNHNEFAHSDVLLGVPWADDPRIGAPPEKCRNGQIIDEDR